MTNLIPVNFQRFVSLSVPPTTNDVPETNGHRQRSLNFPKHFKVSKSIVSGVSVFSNIEVGLTQLQILPTWNILQDHVKHMLIHKLLLCINCSIKFWVLSLCDDQHCPKQNTLAFSGWPNFWHLGSSHIKVLFIFTNLIFLKTESLKTR